MTRSEPSRHPLAITEGRWPDKNAHPTQPMRNVRWLGERCEGGSSDTAWIFPTGPRHPLVSYQVGLLACQYVDSSAVSNPSFR